MTDVPKAFIGNEAMLIGKQRDEEITLEQVVGIRGTELQKVCQSVRNHVPRFYFSK